MKKNLLSLFFLLLAINSSFGQSQYVDDSWIHGSKKVTLTTITDNVGIGTITVPSKLTVLGGGIAGETVSKDYELIIPSPSELNVTGCSNEVNSLGNYQNKLFIGYFSNCSPIQSSSSRVYSWDGNSLSLFYTLGIGQDFGGIGFVQPYQGKLFIGNEGAFDSILGAGGIYVYDPNIVPVNFVQTRGSLGGGLETSAITIPNDSSNNAIFGSTAYSVEYYGRIDDFGVSNSGSIINKIGSNHGFNLSFAASNAIAVAIYDTTARTTTTNTNIISAGNNHDIIFSWTSGSHPIIYVDGIAVGLASSTNITTPSTDVGNIIYMANTAGATFGHASYGGTYRRVRIWRNYAVTSGDATTLAAGGTISQAPTGQYLFTEGTGTTTADSSGNNNTATIVSPAFWNSTKFEVAYNPSQDKFGYAATVYKGKLYVGMGFAASRIYVYDGTTWSQAYAGLSGYGLTLHMYVYKGRIFSSVGGSSGGAIISSSDGINWTTEYTNSSLNSITHFVEFKGNLYVNSQATPPYMYERNSAGGWFQLPAVFPNSGQCWGIENYNNALYTGCTTVGGGAVYKSYDGYTFNLDFTAPNSVTTEPFSMGRYNGSLYVGLGFNTQLSAPFWRKTDSVGQQMDGIDRIIQKFRFNTSSGSNWTDTAMIQETAPMSFDSAVSIGTGFPGVPLDVNGTIRSLSGGYIFPDGSTQTTASPWTVTNINDTILPNNGNVGIGTANTQQSQLTIARNNTTSNTLPMTLYQSSGSLVLDNTANTGTDEALDNAWEAIKFTTGSSGANGEVCVHLKSSVAVTIPPIGQYEIRIFSDNVGVPGSAVAGTLTAFERWGPLTTNYIDRCDLTSITLSANTSYWLVLEVLNAPTTGTISIDSGTTGTNTHAFSSNGTSWTTESNKDGYLKIVSLTPDIISSTPATPTAGGDIRVRSYSNTPLTGVSDTQNGVQGTSLGQGQGGLLIGHYGAGVTTQSNYGISVQSQTIQGAGLYSVQSGNMIFRSNSPALYAERNQTLGAFVSDGPVARVESNVADTGNLFEVIKQSNPKVIVSSTGNTLINGTGGLKVTDSSQLGSEKVTNGTFTGSATGWTLGSGWAYNSNNVTHTAGNTATMTQTIGAVANETYLVTTTVSNTTGNNGFAGTFTVGLGGVTCGTWDDTNKFGGPYFPLVLNYICTATGTGDLTFTPDTNFNATLDTVSVKKITGGNIVALGNVGVGTVNPGTALDVIGTARVSGLIVNGKQPCLQDGTTCPAGTSGVTFTDGVNTVANATQLTVTGGTVGGTTPNGTLVIAGSSQWASQGPNDVSLAGGNVGIGTTKTANAALTVMNGNVGIGTWLPGQIFDVYNGTNHLVFDSAGNIGIGTTSTNLTHNLYVNTLTYATNTLSVNGASLNQNSFSLAALGASTSIKNSSSNSGSNMIYGGSNATNGFADIRSTLGVGSGDYIRFTVGNNGATEAVRMTGIGNVGIGTTTPGQKLDVRGTIQGNSFMGPGGTTPFNGNCGTTAVTSITVDHGVITNCSGV